MAKRLEDKEGNKSSKRLFGALLMTTGLIMALVTFCVSLFHPLGDSATIIKLIAIVLGLGSGLDGLGIFDGVFGRKK